MLHRLIGGVNSFRTQIINGKGSNLFARCLSDVKFDKLEITRTSTPRPKPEDTSKVLFGEVLSDHMLIMDWSESDGWEAPRIIPLGPLPITPAASSLHYGLEVFEGMKAYKTLGGSIQMFRPFENMKRLYRSSGRLSLPFFDKEEVLKCISELVRVDEDWISDQENCSLYIRPTMISTEPTLGVKPPANASLFVITGPVGPYFQTGTFSPVSLLADPNFVRAWPGGVGDCKAGGNYGPTVYCQKVAQSRGCSQCLWLYQDEVTEVGTMNIFMYWINEDGVEELITPSLNGLILPGITRKSLLELARDWDEFQVTEKAFTIQQLAKGVKEGRVKEIFGAGTACVVCPVDKILWNDEFITVENNGFPLAGRFYKELTDIQYGRKEHNWSYLVDSTKKEADSQKL